MPAKGKLLIAEPFLGDPNFERSVVLLCEHNAEGSFGFVLNQLSNLWLNDALTEPVLRNLPLYVGGPVEQNTLHFVHRVAHLEEATALGEHIFWGGDFDQLVSLLNMGKISEQDVRFFVGYSGWGAGQLAEEIAQKSWIISQTNADFIFDTPPSQFWRAVLRQMGGEYRVKSHYPTDPRLN
jgi:putative transcriptional regulator